MMKEMMNNPAAQLAALYVASAILNAVLRTTTAEGLVSKIASYKAGAYMLAAIRTMGADPTKLITMAENFAQRAISDKVSETEKK